MSAWSVYGDGVPHIFTSITRTTTGAGGRFIFQRVLPGKGASAAIVSCYGGRGAIEVTSSTRIAANFPAGKTTHIDLGGSGRLVVGKLAGPAGSQEKVLWQFARWTVQVDLPEPKSPPVPADVEKIRNGERRGGPSGRRRPRARHGRRHARITRSSAGQARTSGPRSTATVPSTSMTCPRATMF